MEKKLATITYFWAQEEQEGNSKTWNGSTTMFLVGEKSVASDERSFLTAWPFNDPRLHGAFQVSALFVRP